MSAPKDAAPPALAEARERARELGYCYRCGADAYGEWEIEAVQVFEDAVRADERAALLAETERLRGTLREADGIAARLWGHLTRGEAYDLLEQLRGALRASEEGQ
jgi:hypothetical protein